MKKHLPKHLTLLFFGIISIIVAGFGYWYVYNAVISQAENYSLAVKESELYNDTKKHEQDLKSIYQQTVDGRAKLSSYIVSEDKIVTLIESLENIGKASGAEVSLSSIDSGEMNSLEKGAFGHIKIHIDISGRWSSVMTAISMLENMPYSLSLQQSKLSSTVEKGTVWNFSTDVYIVSIK